MGLLVGAPLADALFGSFWDDLSPFSAATAAPRPCQRVDDLLELRHDATALNTFFASVRDMLDRASACGVETRYVEAARDRIDRAVDTLMNTRTDFASAAVFREFSSLDALLSAVANSCRLKAGQLSAGLPASASSLEGGMMMMGDDPDPYNQPPTPQNDYYSVVHGRTLYVGWPGVLGNDTDPDGDSLTISSHTDPYPASWFNFYAGGLFDYVSPCNYAGQATFTYEVDDGHFNTAQATVTIDVTNQAPVAGGTSVSVMHGQSCTIDVGSLSSDADGDALDAFIVSQPASGAQLSVSGGTIVSYTPPSSFAGSDSFTYQVYDGIAYSDAATVSITVLNEVPTAGSATLSTLHDHSASSYLTGNDADNDPLTWSIATGPYHGYVQFDGGNSSPNGTVSYTYTPHFHYAGPDSFTFTVSDGIATSAPATVSVSVTNQAPTANADGGYETDAQTSLDGGGLLANDSDPDGDSLTVIACTTNSASGAAVSLRDDGSFTYTPTGMFAGTDSFQYRVNDGVDDSEYTSVSIDVTPKAVIRIAGLVGDQTRNPGGLVVRTAGGNNAGRQQITLSVVPEDWNGSLLLSADSKVSVWYGATAGEQVAFGGGGGAFQASSMPVDLYVQGESASGSMRDIDLTLQPQGVNGGADHAKFTVLWVDVTTAFSGPISSDNDKRDLQRSVTEAKTYDLGLQEYAYPGAAKTWAWGFETKGVVHPSDFAYPGSDLKLGRDVERRSYDGPFGSDLAAVRVPHEEFPPGNDDSGDLWRDDNPADSNPRGSIYDLDAPALVKRTANAGTTQRYRGNFRAYAQITTPAQGLVVASYIDFFYVRFSIRQTDSPSGNTWVVDYGVCGDNNAGAGTTPLCWNLE